MPQRTRTHRDDSRRRGASGVSGSARATGSHVAFARTVCWSALAFALLGGAAFLLFFDSGDVSRSLRPSSDARGEHASSRPTRASRKVSALDSAASDSPRLDLDGTAEDPSHSDAIRISPLAPSDTPGEKPQAPSEELVPVEAEHAQPVVPAAERPEPTLHLRPPRDQAERRYEGTGIVIRPATAPADKRD